MAGAERRGIFLDRDGTLIHDMGYPRDAQQVQLLPGAVAALARLRDEGWLLVLISNQSGIGRGLVTAEEAEQVHSQVIASLAAQGIELTGAYYCPHAPEEKCQCRKPAPGMLRQAAKELHIDLGSSFMIGDKPSDIEAGKRAGCRTILFGYRWPVVDGRLEDKPDHVAANWTEVIDCIRKDEG